MAREPYRSDMLRALIDESPEKAYRKLLEFVVALAGSSTSDAYCADIAERIDQVVSGSVPPHTNFNQYVLGDGRPQDMSEEQYAELLGAVARGWCAPENAHKVMDADLALAIAAEVRKLCAGGHGDDLIAGTADSVLERVRSRDMMQDRSVGALHLPIEGAEVDDRSDQYIATRADYSDLEPFAENTPQASVSTRTPGKPWKQVVIEEYVDVCPTCGTLCQVHSEFHQEGDGKSGACMGGEKGEYTPLDQDLRGLLERGLEAMRLTREYVGEGLLHPSPGWEWFEWCEAVRAALGMDKGAYHIPCKNDTDGDGDCPGCARGQFEPPCCTVIPSDDRKVPA